MSNIVGINEARQVVNSDNSPFLDMPRWYRYTAMFHRALMVAFFWHEGLFRHHANEMLNYIDWAFLEERKKAQDKRGTE